MKLILLDSNSLLNRGYYALPALTDSKGRHTGAIYGFTSMLSKLIQSENPTHIAAAFDLHAPTFRHKQYAAYKGTRKPMPEDLREQVPVMKELLRCMGIKVLELEGYEADDILGTLALKFDIPTLVVSGDKDCLQLVSDSTTILYTRKGISDVVRYDRARLAEDGLTPNGVIELKALMGDHSDNIPGVMGVGEKTAKDLLATYSNIDNLYANVGDIKGKLQEKLIAHKDEAYLSKSLATINTDIPITVTLADIQFKNELAFCAKQIMVDYEFKGLINRFSFADTFVEQQNSIARNIEISDKSGLNSAIAEVRKAGKLAVNINNDSVSFAYSEDIQYNAKFTADLLGDALTFDDIISALLQLIEDKNVCKLIFDVKSFWHSLQLNVNSMSKLDDIMLMGYIADSGRSCANVTELLNLHGYSADCICAQMLSLGEKLRDKMQADGSYNVYKEIELPLIPVLYGMEQQGFRVDKQVICELSEKYSKELGELSADIYSISGHYFNINSPKQLSEVLFDELKLPTAKKRSTNADILSDLEEMHPIIPLIMRYRQLSKLVSTYLVGMPQLLDGRGRVHTVFKQAVTSTGRLSSTEPNLQNIPVREEDGKEIRRAFIASESSKLISADYSQIELRLLAHYSQDDKLINAFVQGQDIHSITAAHVFGVPLDEVNNKMRRSAKAVNFGIIYGISDFGLSKNIGCTVKTAKEFIEKYFDSYPNVKAYMNSSVEKARKDGYISTVAGRIRSIPEINSSNYNLRSFGERAAMNMPLQGSAADIIKIAMINVHSALKIGGYKAKLILQVHDELIIDSPYDEVKAVSALVKELMEKVVPLSVPLTVNVEIGDNWKEAK